MSGGFYFYLHLYRYLYLYLLKNRLKPHQIMVSGGSLGKDSTLDERSGLDNFVLMLRPGWIRHQTDFVEARVSKTLPAQPSDSDPRHSDSNEEIVRHVGLGPAGKMAGSSRLPAENDS